MTMSTLQMGSLQSMGDRKSALLPVKPQATIEEIMAQVKDLSSPHVELLVPNNTEALQSLAGCEALNHALSAAGIRATLFTSDPKTAGAARIAKLDLVAVGPAIASPSEPPSRRRPSRQMQVPLGRPDETGEGVAVRPVAMTPPPQPISSAAPVPAERAGPPASEPSFMTGRPASDQDFLAGLLAFDQTQEDSSHGAWESAFDDVAATAAVQPVRTRPPVSGRAQAGNMGRRPRRHMLAAFASALPWPRKHPASAAKGAAQPVRRPRPPSQEAPVGARRPHRLLFWPLALLGLVIAGVTAWPTVRSLGILPGTATVTITPRLPKSAQPAFTGITVPIQEQPVVDQASYAVQSAILERPASVIVQGQAISTTLTPVGRASGPLFLRNKTTQPLLIRAGTIVSTAKGIQFTVDADTTVPAEDTSNPDIIRFGKGQVTVTAVVPGNSGNIPPGSIVSIPGFGGNLGVEQGQFSGGSDQEVHIVRTEDVNRILPGAVSQLYGKGTEVLQSSVRSDFKLATSTITPTLESLQHLQEFDYGVFPPVGAVAEDGIFKLELRAVFRGAAEPANQPLDQQVTRAVHNQLANTGRIGDDTQLQVKSLALARQGLLVDVVAASSARPSLPRVFVNQVQTAIAGKPRREAINYLQSLVKDGKIADFSPLPEQWATVPQRVSVNQTAP